ncbi:MAG: hypothetical protein IJK93_00500 [Muribaculaceae bacterium]|nr:hypothetical protein [Muribaculaceae bacterium]
MTNDSIICLLRDDGNAVNCFQNHALDYVESNGRNLINRIGYVGMSGLELLYPLNSWNHYLQNDYLIGIYLQYQVEPFLTEDNFFLYDSLEMDGYNCYRYAYIGEDGEPVAYIVEGIGFDSRDMGDLLTPFTRKPEPDADYQEYCGLCHVVKDGKIIYKGMRYNPDNMTGIDEVVTDKTRTLDANYYNMMGVPVGKELPTTPGIYIHQGKKICVSY